MPMLQLLGYIVIVSGVVTGSAVYWTRKNNETNLKLNQDSISRSKASNKENLEDIKITTRAAINELKETIQIQGSQNREDSKGLLIHLDERIEKIYHRLDTTASELKEYVANEVSQLKAKDYDQDVKLDNSKDKLNSVNEALLRFKLEVSEKYERKNGN